MTDRCDVEAAWILFASCGRPFFFCWDEPQLMPILRQERRRHVGVTLELRSGNHAAATLEELTSCWPEPRFSTHPEGKYVYVAPHDLNEGEQA